MAARLSKAEAKALGLPVPAPTKTRREASGPYLTVCRTCGEEFTTMAAETRHLVDTHHARYEVIFEPEAT